MAAFEYKTKPTPHLSHGSEGGRSSVLLFRTRAELGETKNSENQRDSDRNTEFLTPLFYGSKVGRADKYLNTSNLTEPGSGVAWEGFGQYGSCAHTQVHT